MNTPREGGAPCLVVIDGPAGAGKTTVARRVAAHFGMALLDTGAIYRALALHAKRHAVGWGDEAGLAVLAREMPLRFTAGPVAAPQQVWLADEDVTDAIRASTISEGASQVSVHREVRRELLELQRRLGRQSGRGCVAEGRDMGTVVFPGATYKFFLTADGRTRAQRRHLEMVGVDPQRAPTLADVAADMLKRDERDLRRTAAPLAKASDAEVIDSSAWPEDEVVARIVRVIEKHPR
ncbi:MAG: (d)CMP kinase [Nannocystaceae bacterium]